MTKTPICLTIAGSDSGGGAGIQADLKVMSALGVYGASVITALTAQNTKEVRSIFPATPEFIIEQIETVYDDLEIDAVKIGMLGTPEITFAVASALRAVKAKNIVLDPVMVAKSGDKLLSDDAVDALKQRLIPMADIITPNIPEAMVLLDTNTKPTLDNMGEYCTDLLKLGAKSVLLKGGHMTGETLHDLYSDGAEMMSMTSPRIDTKNTHGTGCSMSSAIASELAKGGDMKSAVQVAKEYIAGAVQNADKLNIGTGSGAIHHFYKVW